MQAPDFETEDFLECPRKQTYDQPVDQSFHRKIEDILSFRNKKSEAPGNLHNMICHALMDHLTESGSPLRKLRKAISGYMLVSGGVHTHKLHLFGVGLRSE